MVGISFDPSAALSSGHGRTSFLTYVENYNNTISDICQHTAEQPVYQDIFFYINHGVSKKSGDLVKQTGYFLRFQIYLPVTLSPHALTSSGVPQVTILPPASPPPGPMSII